MSDYKSEKASHVIYIHVAVKRGALRKVILLNSNF